MRPKEYRIKELLREKGIGWSNRILSGEFSLCNRIRRPSAYRIQTARIYPGCHAG